MLKNKGTSSGTLSQTLDLGNFVMTHRSSECVVDLSPQRWMLSSINWAVVGQLTIRMVLSVMADTCSVVLKTHTTTRITALCPGLPG